MKLRWKAKQLREQVEAKKVLTDVQTQTLIKLILRVSGSFGTAVMLPATLPILRYALEAAQHRDTLKVYTVADLRPEITIWLLGAAVICLLYGLYSLFRLYPIAKQPIYLKTEAARQWQDFFGHKAEGGAVGLFAAVSMCVGIVLALGVPDLLISEYILPFVVIEILTFGIGIRAIVSLILYRCIFRRLRLVFEEQEEGVDKKTKKKTGPILWIFYWLLIIGLYTVGSFLFDSFLLYLYIPVIGLMQFGIFHFANRASRKGTERSGLILILRNILAGGTVAFVCWIALISGSWINDIYIQSLDYNDIGRSTCAIEYDEDTGVYTITGKIKEGKGEFRILQLTDIHLGGSLTTVYSDRKALDACYAVIRKAEPDLIVITGDIAYPIPLQSFTLNNKTPLFQLRTFMNNIGIPWVIVYGNHDTETEATESAEEISRSYAEYARQNPSLLYADRQPDIYGRYNQYIQIRNQDGSLNRILFLMDSNDYVVTEDGFRAYDSVHENQIQWYGDTIRKISGEEGRCVPSFVFMHIPLPAFAQAKEALENGTGEAEYQFGVNAEKVSCSADDHGFFRSMVEEKSTEAVFVGHDHVNNMGIKYHGIDLVYSKSIDYIAYPGIAGKSQQRGGTLIRVFYDGYSIEQIHYKK